MNLVSMYSTQSELSFAVYANLRLGTNTRADLQSNNSRINDSLADYLADRYTVQAIHNDPLTGAYAVLFFDTQTEQQTLAIRGTDGATDVLANLHLLVGVPAWMSLQYQSLVSKIEQWQVQGLIGPQTTITGHSLGGYLAAAIKSYYPSSFGATYTFNAPGLGGALGSVAQFFQGAFGIAPNLSQVYGLRGAAGLSLIAGTGAQLGQIISVEIEPAAGLGSANHRIARISQSLAVFELLAKLDPQINLTRANQMLAAASEQRANALENLIYGLDRSMNPGSTPIPTDNDQALYERLNSLQDSPTFKSLTGKLTISLPNSSLSTTAKTDFATFLSLNALSPVVLSTTDAGAQAALQQANPALFTAWNADKNARLYGDTSKVFDYSDNWYADRAALLQSLAVAHTKDAPANPDGYLAVQGTTPSDTNTRYIDIGSGKLLQENNARISPSTAPIKYVMFGSDAANEMNGGSQTDRLYGGADTLLGGLGQVSSRISRRHQAEAFTSHLIALCAENTPARGRFGTQNIISGKYMNFELNQQLAGTKSAQSAIEFAVNGGKA